MRQHVFSGDPPVGCFMDAKDGLKVSSPEFCFLQMAGYLPLAGLVELGYEFCGTYSMPIEGDAEVPARGFYHRGPLTSMKKISAFIARMPDFRGRKKAARALRYLLDGSASPMETKLAMFLVLPYKLGGFGLPAPELNARVVPSKTAGKSSNKVFYVCDLFWQDHNLAVEYDSDQFHTGSEHIADDSRKRNALASMGVTVITVTTRQLYDSREFEKAAHVIANRLGKRLAYKNPGFAAAHRELRDQLL